VDASIYAVSAEPIATGAYLRIIVALKFKESLEAPLHVNGLVHAPHDTMLCPLYQVPPDGGIDVGLGGGAKHSRTSDPTTRYLWLGAILGRPELDHLVAVRDKDRKGDVHLDIKIEVRYLESNATVIHLERGAPNKSFTGGPTPVSIVDQPTDRSQRVLSDGGAHFVSVRTVVAKLQHTIPSGDWVHDFAPKFGLGKFCVFELPQPEVFGAGALRDRAKVALEVCTGAEEALREGRWSEVCQRLRKVWELIRNDSDIEALLKRDGYTEAAAKALNDSVRHMFEFSSKFLHVLDKTGNIVGPPEIVAQKEDAYFAFATAMSILNIIAQKSR